ncbi:MAG: AraC family transcriptional regulator [Pseudomonadota bacterium]
MASPIHANEDELGYSDIERAASALSVKLQPNEPAAAANDAVVMHGTIVADRVAPHLFAAGLALRYAANVPLVQEVEDFVHLSLLVSGIARPLKIDGLSPVVPERNRTLALSVPDRALCRGEPRAGDESIVAGLSFNSALLDHVVSGDQSLEPLRILFSGGPRHCTYPRLRGLCRFGDELVEPRFCGALRKFHIDSCVLEAVSEFARMLSDEFARPPGMTMHQYRRVQDARDMLEHDLANPPSIETICKTLAVNATTLRQQFRKVHGMSMFSFLRARRLSVARLLLRDTDKAIGDIGFRVGFTNAAAFTVAYGRQFGHPPSAERSHPQ